MACSLLESQRGFAAALLADEEPADRGLAVYRATVRTNWRRALAATYEVVKRIVGEPFFHAAADAYAMRHPSREGDLNGYGDRFGDFLERYDPARGLAYLPDVARLEWALDECLRAAPSPHAPAAVLADLGRVMAEDLVRSGFVLAPSCRLVLSGHPVLAVWRVHQADHRGPLAVDWESGGDRVLVRRDEAGASLESLPPAEAAFLAALAAGESLGEALAKAVSEDGAFDVGATLGRRIADGTLAGISRRA